jgi:hypothetical protein
VTWLHVDDAMPEHPKIQGLSDAAFRLHIRGLAYCARLLTDGHVPEKVALQMLPTRSRRALDQLVTDQIWHRENGGFEIHDYLDYNPSREHVLAKRKARSEAGKRGNQARWGSQERSQTRSQTGSHKRSQTRSQTGTPPIPPKGVSSPLPPQSGGSQMRDLEPVEPTAALTPRLAGTNPRATAERDREARAHQALVQRARDQYQAWLDSGDQPAFAAEQLRECFPAVAAEVLA